MSQNRRKRNRNRAKGSGGEAKGQSSNAKKQNQNKNKRNEPKIDPVEFWGDPVALPEPIRTIDEVPDPKAVVRSLGRVPLSGQETAAEHWLSLVYERAAVLAGALAAAGGLQGDPDD
ncbi:MAG: hypothetical protein AAF081_13580 [Actinomycetota bacterium]